MRAHTTSTSPAVRALVDQLVTILTESNPPPWDVEQLLDIEVNGVRCRCHRVARTNHVALSPREREIVRMVANGRTNQSIASVLGISTWTVSTYLRRIFAKLEVNSRAAMVAYVLGRDQLVR